MPARRKAAILICVVAMMFVLRNYSFAEVVSISVTVSKSATLTFPDTLDSSNNHSLQTSNLDVKSNAYWSLLLNEERINSAQLIGNGNNIETLFFEELELKPGRRYIITVMQ